jgi:hypothetical protein
VAKVKIAGKKRERDFFKTPNPPAAHATEGFTSQTGMVAKHFTVVRGWFSIKGYSNLERDSGFSGKPEKAKLIDMGC